jgi:hypothetical protein
MNSLSLLIKMLLFFYPFYRWVFLLGGALVATGLTLSWLNIASNQLRNILFDVGLLLAAVIPTLLSGVVLRQLLSNRHFALLPQFRIKALQALVMVSCLLQRIGPIFSTATHRIFGGLFIHLHAYHLVRFCALSFRLGYVYFMVWCVARRPLVRTNIQAVG